MDNRGGDAGSLFLVNNCVETTPAPKPSSAAIVNAYSFLLTCAKKCEQKRRPIPNIIAVNFYRTGDLMKVTDRLNGVASELPDLDTVSRLEKNRAGLPSRHLT